MKKTLTINLAGTIFHIDEDAYNLLDSYLSNLKTYFNNQHDADEIVDDLEMRISELFAEKLSSHREVITITDVEEIIAQIGRPEDFALNTDENDVKTSAAETTQEQDTPIHRKLYRNPDDKILGGVLSGLAAYFNWDPTVVRLLAVFLLPISGSLIPVYLLMWILIPTATTAAEKLSMRGEKVTVENIGKTVKKDYAKTKEPRQESSRNIGAAFVSFIGVLMKILLVILLIACSPVIFALIVAFFALLIAGFAAIIGGSVFIYDIFPSFNCGMAAVSPGLALLYALSGISLVLLPLGGVGYICLQHFLHWKPMTTVCKWILVGLWIVALVLVIIGLTTVGPVWHIGHTC